MRKNDPIRTGTALELLEPRQMLAFSPISIGSSGYDSGFKIAAMPDGGTVVAGQFSETCQFGNGVTLTATNDVNVFVARYSSTGSLIWVKQFASTEGELNDNKVIDTATDPERAGPFDEGVGIETLDLGIYPNGVASDAAGNVYFTGTFRGTVDFNPGRGKTIFNSFGGNDYVDTFLLKLNNGGGLSFARQIGGPFTDVANAIKLDSSGNIYLTGYYSRECDFDPTSGVVKRFTQGREDIFTAKYGTRGQLIWVNNTSNDEVDRTKRSAGYAVDVDSSGNVYVTGTFARNTQFDPRNLANPSAIPAFKHTDTFIEKLSPTGQLIWVKSIGGDGYDGGLAIAVGPNDQSIYVGSYFQDTADVDPGPGQIYVTATPDEPGEDPKKTDLLISKFDPNGAFVWAKPIGGPGWETLGGMVVDSDGNVYTTGGFYLYCDFDPSRATFIINSVVGVDNFDDPNDDDRDYSYDVFLQKLDRNGKFQWATSFGAQSDDYGTALALNASAQPIIAGQFRGTVVFPNSTEKLRPIGTQDAFIALFDTDGDVV